MPLSNVQKGAIGQFAFLSTALATGGGEVEAYAPVADNERRDAEIRRHLKSTPGVMVQVKVAFSASVYGGPRSKYLRIVFSVRASRLESDARFWYFFALYDTAELRLHDPCFLIASDAFHKIGRDGKPSKGLHWFSITANLDANSRDKWTRYRVAPKDLGKRLLAIVDNTTITASRRQVTLPPEGIWLSRARRGSRIAARRGAA